MNAFSESLNRAMRDAARRFDVVVADGFRELRLAAAHSADSTCNAGLLTQLGKPGDGGIHPSFAGQALLAQALLKAITTHVSAAPRAATERLAPLAPSGR